MPGPLEWLEELDSTSSSTRIYMPRANTSQVWVLVAVLSWGRYNGSLRKRQLKIPCKSHFWKAGYILGSKYSKLSLQYWDCLRRDSMSSVNSNLYFVPKEWVEAFICLLILICRYWTVTYTAISSKSKPICSFLLLRNSTLRLTLSWVKWACFCLSTQLDSRPFLLRDIFSSHCFEYKLVHLSSVILINKSTK